MTVVAKAWAEHLRWFWALHFPSKSGRRSKNLRTDNRAATLEEAKAQFQKSWDEWKEWAKMEEVPYPRLARLPCFRTAADFF